MKLISNAKFIRGYSTFTAYNQRVYILSSSKLRLSTGRYYQLLASIEQGTMEYIPLPSAVRTEVIQ